MNNENLWAQYNDKELNELENICIDYKECLNQGKTERECVKVAIKYAEQAGYVKLEEIIKNGKKLNSGDKVYATHMEKAIVMFHIGKGMLEKGMNILGAHIDSPRLDLKQNPLYEEDGFAYFDTHYYGGIKKYQWVTIPLAIHGVLVRKDGSKQEIVIGEDEEDPVFVITDILVHLAKEEMEKTANKVIQGEKLDLLIGNKKVKNEEKDAVKAGIIGLLKEKYNVEEEDFISAEIEIVPSGKARDCGLDKSMIIGYGQDDRVCAFASLFAMLKNKPSDRTTCCILVDKEEIGSVGATGMQSKFFENTVAEIMDRVGEYSELKVRRALANSKMLSSDVSAGYDPLFPDKYEKRNSAFLSKGLVINKYTGSGGKYGTNDANPEYVAKLRRIFEKNDIAFQTAELGGVDVGGGGTIAHILAAHGMEVIDSGIAVLCMHAPWEVASKADIYEAVKGYGVFLEEA